MLPFYSSQSIFVTCFPRNPEAGLLNYAFELELMDSKGHEIDLWEPESSETAGSAFGNFNVHGIKAFGPDPAPFAYSPSRERPLGINQPECLASACFLA